MKIGLPVNGNKQVHRPHSITEESLTPCLVCLWHFSGLVYTLLSWQHQCITETSVCVCVCVRARVYTCNWTRQLCDEWEFQSMKFTWVQWLSKAYMQYPLYKSSDFHLPDCQMRSCSALCRNLENANHKIVSLTCFYGHASQRQASNCDLCVSVWVCLHEPNEPCCVCSG